MSRQNIDQAMQQAVSHHQAGQLAQAEQIYRQVLGVQPNHPDALHLLGIIAGQAGRHDIAADLIQKAIAISPQNGAYYSNLGMSLLSLQQTQKAIEVFQQAIKLHPQNAEAHYRLGGTFLSIGQLKPAITAYQQAIAIHPYYFEAMHNLGNALVLDKQFDQAVTVCHNAILLNPNFAPTHNNLGNALKNKKQLTEAIAAYRQAISLDPNYAEAHNNLGNTLQDAEEIDAAIAAYHAAIALNPQNAEFHCNLGTALMANDEVEQAIAAYEKSIALDAQYPNAYFNLAIAWMENDEVEKSIACQERAIALKPDYFEAMLNLGAVYAEADQFERGIETLNRAKTLRPESAEPLNNIGVIYRTHDMLEPALHCFQQALALEPRHIKAVNNLGGIWKSLGKLDEAHETYHQALSIAADNADAFAGLGGVYQDMGQMDLAIQHYQKAIDIDPDRIETFEGQLFAMLYDAASDPLKILEAHVRWAKQHTEDFKDRIRPFKNTPQLERRLRIGYISGDFRMHSVNFFFEPLLEAHNKEIVEIYCYSNLRTPDAATRRLQASASAWREIFKLDDDEVAKLIRRDRIDILIEMSGHTGHNRLQVLAQQAAPIQASFLGYPATVGLSTVDYRVTDNYADPPGMTENQYTETLIRLPKSAWCYRPSTDASEVGPTPALQSRQITFGSMNYRGKISDYIIDCWMRILTAVPASRLIIKGKGVTSKGSSGRIQSLMGRHQITADRVELIEWIPASEHYKHFSRIDIALDSYPYHGTTTTCETLWMGVPVVTLAGNAHVSRVGVSLLTNIGLPQLVAQTPEQYVQIAADLAADVPRLADLRAGMRRRMLESPLMDAKTYAGDMESAFRVMWQRWCADTLMVQSTARRKLEVAEAHITAGRFSDAEAIYQQLMEQYPSNAKLAFALGILAGKADRVTDAVKFLERAASLAPAEASYSLQLGLHHRKAGNLPAAVISLQRAVALKPADAEYHFFLANALQFAGEYDQCLVSYRRSLAIRPDYAEALGNLGGACKSVGLLDESIACYRRAVELNPGGTIDHDGLLGALLCHPSSAPQQILEESVCWNTQHAAPLGHLTKPHENDRDPERQLRIGYLSGDFRLHSVSYFFEPLIETHNPEFAEIYCYANLRTSDAVTLRLQASASVWRDIFRLDDDAVAELIRRDRIDILIEMSGHTHQNRLKMLAQKPAPILASFLGYPATIGLSTIDYRITDIYADPPGLTENQYTETLIRLPKSAWCYRPPTDASEVAPTPAFQSGQITFGSLNHRSKISDYILDCWMQILAAVPDSRLIIKAKGSTSKGSSGRIENCMSRHGITADRVELIEWIPASEHYKHFSRIDIALDSYPYHGTTTTCETLWMGVPVVTLAGNAHVSRVGVSLLTNIGLPQLVAQTPEQYVQIAADLASDIPRLADLRTGMRQRMLDSPLMDAKTYARDIESALRSIWQRWCDVS